MATPEALKQRRLHYWPGPYCSAVQGALLTRVMADITCHRCRRWLIKRGLYRPTRN